MAEMEVIGGKRKYKENAFTAKAETGTLKVKILRKDLGGGGGAAAAARNGSEFVTAARTTTTQIETQRSPPKPRPNRKHVPIFYQRQMPMESSTSSTDESVAAVSQTMSTASDDQSSSQQHSDSAPGSYSNRFSSLLSGLHLDGATISSNSGNTASSALPRPPASNPLFSRNDSDGTSALFNDVLRHSFPSAQGAAPPLGSFAQSGSAATALHQLAASSSAYGAASLASLSSAASDVANSPQPQPTLTSTYRFNPFTALQSAIDVHQATLSASAPGAPHAPYQYPHERQHALARADASMGDEDDDDPDASAMSDLGPPPSAPPAFAVQNSLMGGGIELQPVIANVNTYNFDWSSGAGRPRSGSLPNILEAAGSNGSSGSGGGDSSASNAPMWKEI